MTYGMSWELRNHRLFANSIHRESRRNHKAKTYQSSSIRTPDYPFSFDSTPEIRLSRSSLLFLPAFCSRLQTSNHTVKGRVAQLTVAHTHNTPKFVPSHSFVRKISELDVVMKVCIFHSGGLHSKVSKVDMLPNQLLDELECSNVNI